MWRERRNKMEQHRAFAVRVGAAAVLLVALLAGSSSALAASETPRGGDLVVSKECSGFVNDPPYCAITSSSLDAIPVGSKIIYLNPAGLGTAAGCRRPRPAWAWEQQGVRHMLPRREPDALRVLRGNREVHLVPRQRRGHGYRRGAADRAVALVRDVQLQSSLKRANTPRQRRGTNPPRGEVRRARHCAG